MGGDADVIISAITKQGESFRADLKGYEDKNSKQHEMFFESLNKINDRHSREDGASEAEEKAEGKMIAVANLHESKEKTGLISLSTKVSAGMFVLTAIMALFTYVTYAERETSETSKPKVVIHENIDRK